MIKICNWCGKIETNPTQSEGCDVSTDYHHDWREHVDYGMGQKSPMSKEEKSKIVAKMNGDEELGHCVGHCTFNYRCINCCELNGWDMSKATSHKTKAEAFNELAEARDPYYHEVGGQLDQYMPITVMQARIHQQNKEMGWWDNPREMGTLLCLVHSEISEAMEGERKNLMDDHLPTRSMLEVELADAMIRIMDIAASRNLDLAGAIVEKVEYNRTRADHQPGARAEAYGKKF